MTVKQLRKLLKGFDPDEQVWIAGDPEGNEFHPATSWGYHSVDDEDEDVARVVIWP